MNKSLSLSEIDQYLRKLYAIDDMKRIDSSLNGLQVGDLEKSITKVAFSVDACRESFERAKVWEADLLLCHHGLFWGSQFTLTGEAFKRFSYLFKNDLALYAIHLPLDMHLETGNNSGLAKELGLLEVEAFGAYKGFKIGVKGILPKPMSIEEVTTCLFGHDRATLGLLPFGKEKNLKVGIISGGASSSVQDAIDEGLDLFITGDADHTIYHRCLEAGINVIFGGHYQTEIWGVALLAKRMKQELGLETTFIDIPTGY